MDPADILPLVEQLDDNIDDLEDVLSPLLQSPLSDIAGKLPLLDKAQLYILTTFAMESLLFSYLRLNAVNAKEHPVFRELARVKQYFAKVTEAESSEGQRGIILNKPAAGRFIKHALAGNEKQGCKKGYSKAEHRPPSHIKFEQASGKRKHEDINSSLTNSGPQETGAMGSLLKNSPGLPETSPAARHGQTSSTLDERAEHPPTESFPVQGRQDAVNLPERKKRRRTKSKEDKHE